MTKVIATITHEDGTKEVMTNETKKFNPFDKSFKAEYELAKKIGDKKFGTECEHSRILYGKCLDCLRKVHA